MNRFGNWTVQLKRAFSNESSPISYQENMLLHLPLKMCFLWCLEMLVGGDGLVVTGCEVQAYAWEMVETFVLFLSFLQTFVWTWVSHLTCLNLSLKFLSLRWDNACLIGVLWGLVPMLESVEFHRWRVIELQSTNIMHNRSTSEVKQLFDRDSISSIYI